MPLKYRSRQSGIEFSVGCFLFGLGAGQLLNTPGFGLHLILAATGHLREWTAWMLVSALVLVLGSMQEYQPKVRLGAVVTGLICWATIAYKFVEAHLWGGALQAMVGVALLNQCMFKLIWYLIDGDQTHQG